MGHEVVDAEAEGRELEAAWFKSRVNRNHSIRVQDTHLTSELLATHISISLKSCHSQSSCYNPQTTMDKQTNQVKADRKQLHYW